MHLATSRLQVSQSNENHTDNNDDDDNDDNNDDNSDNNNNSNTVSPLCNHSSCFWGHVAISMLSGSLQALRVVTDSKYVYDGILKHLRRWRLQGRPFLNSDLWLQLQAEVDARVAPTLWRHVYSGGQGYRHSSAVMSFLPLQRTVVGK